MKTNTNRTSNKRRRQLNVLCLHGMCQDAEVFRSRISRITKKFENIHLVFIDAPYFMDKKEGDDVAMRTWYQKIKTKSNEEVVDVPSLQLALEYIENVWNDGVPVINKSSGSHCTIYRNFRDNSGFGNEETSGRVCRTNIEFDGILGFSQGGVMASYIASCYPSKYSSLKFVFVAGAPDRIPWDIIEPNHPSKVSPDIHSLHVMGESDNVVSMELMQSLADRFHEPVIITHEQGHCIPSKPSQVAQYIKFMKHVHNQLPLASNTEASVFESSKRCSDLLGNVNEPLASLAAPPLPPHRYVYPKLTKESMIQHHEEYNCICTIYNGMTSENSDSMLCLLYKNEEYERYADEFAFDSEIIPRKLPSESVRGDDTLRSSISYQFSVLLTLSLPDRAKHPFHVNVSVYSNYLVESEIAVIPPPIAVELDLGMTSMVDFPLSFQLGLLQALRKVIACDLLKTSGDSGNATDNTSVFINNTPILYELIECALAWISHPVEAHKGDDIGSVPIAKASTVVTAGKDTVGDEPSNEIEDSAIRGVNIEELRLATEIAYITAVNRLTAEAESMIGVDSTRKGGIWKYTVGLVGKPSAGKSSFYNAVTRAALKSNDGRYVAAVSPHPFTTIEPNVGPGWFLGPRDSDILPAPDDAQGSGLGENKTIRPLNKLEELLDGPNNCTRKAKVVTTHGAVYGRDPLTNRRLLPVIIKDVAGLVPGAYQGRGKGNKFLNDLCDADVLIHVVDASGSATADGCVVGADLEGASLPHEDIVWIREEIHHWIYNNITAKWNSIARLSEKKTHINDSNSTTSTVHAQQLDRLCEMMSGYQGISHKHLVDKAIVRLKLGYDIYPRHMQANSEASTCNIGVHKSIADWNDFDRHCFVAHYISVRFPTCVGLNKIDRLLSNTASRPDATPKISIDYIRSLVEQSRSRGEVAVPMSALIENYKIQELSQELSQQNEMNRSAGSNSNADINMMSLLEKCCEVSGSNGLDTVPQDKKGWKDINSGVMDVITAAVQLNPPLYVYPVVDLDSEISLGYVHSRGTDSSKIKNANGKLSECMICKPGITTVEDLYHDLKHTYCNPSEMITYLSGQYIRSDGKPLVCHDAPDNLANNSRRTSGSAVTNRSRYQCGRETVLSEQIAILHIQTNKKVSWQHKLK